VTEQVPLSSWYGALLHGVIGFTPNTSWLQLVAFLGYVVPVMVLFFHQPAAPPAPVAPVEPSAAEAPAVVAETARAPQPHPSQSPSHTTAR
jgi:high-affinity iron transporter